MAKGKLNGVLQHLRRVAILRNAADSTDGELLEVYLTNGDEAAFELLLERHGPMVLGVCRRVLRNEADAHDAFQATFLVFLQKAASIFPRGKVGNWLYGVAHKTALKAKALNRQRRVKERQAWTRPWTSPPEEVQQELLTRLDEAISRLPSKYRAPVVLCELEGKSLKEAARQLGCPLGTVASRLARGREMLAKRLACCGLSLARGILAHGTVSACVPTSLIVSTVQAATALAAGQAAAAAVLSPKVVALAEGVVKAMLMKKLKALTAVLLAVTLLGSRGMLLTYSTLRAEPKDARQAGQVSAAAPKDEKAKPDKETLQGTWVAKSGERNGTKLSEEELKEWEQLVFAGDKVTREAKERREGTYTIDPDKKPKEIDLFTEANTWKGIYELKGTTLKLCVSFGERPSDFDSEVGRRALLIVFEKKDAQ
jgi:RNA polymerase sigma-70 factor (ECF subfamily)